MDKWEFFIAGGVQTILFLATGYAMILRNDWNAQSLKDQVENMQEELRKLAEVITEQAVQTTRIDNLAEQFTLLQRTVEDLRRGDGWIRTGSNKEYGSNNVEKNR